MTVKRPRWSLGTIPDFVTWSAFHLNGKIGFPGGKPNGTGLSTENFSKNREYLQRYSSFFVFTGITGKSLYHLLYHTSTMLLGKISDFAREWRPLSCLSVQYAVFILNKRNVFWRHRSEKKQSYHLATKCIDFLGQYTFRNERNHSRDTATCNIKSIGN